MNAKRILAFILSVLMVISCVPNVVFATEGDEVSAIADTATRSNTVTVKMFDTEVTGDGRYFGITNGGSFGAKFTLPSDHRLTQIRVHSLAAYGDSAVNLHFYLYSGSTYGQGTLLNHVTIPSHADNADLVINIGVDEYYEGSLWFKVVKESGKQAVSPVRANKSVNGTTYVNGKAAPFCLTIQYEPDLRKHAEANFVQHSTDDPIKTYQIQNHTDSSGKPKTDFKRPTDRGFLTIEGVGGDPFFEIGTLDAQLSKLPAHKMDYIVVKYRTSNVEEGRFFYSFVDSNGVGNYSGELSTPIDFNPSGEWETVIVRADDLSGRNDAVRNLRFDYNDAPTKDGKNPWMDIAYIRFFATPEAAQACVDAEEHSVVALPITIRDYRADGMMFEYNALDPQRYDGVGYENFNLGNNSGFALTTLIGSNANMFLDKYDPELKEMFDKLVGVPSVITGEDTYIGNGNADTFKPESAIMPAPIEVILNSGAKQNVYGAEIRYDLVEAELGENGKPVYRQGVVEFIAWYLWKLLPVTEKDDAGKVNMNFIKGETDKAFDGKDLATYLREKLADAPTGTYEETKAKAKDLVNGHGLDSVETYMDAAYFLLHNTFVDNPGYGLTAEEYNTLNLVAKTDANGNVRYVFSTAYDNIIYDRVDGIIQNSQFEKATQRIIQGYPYYHRGNQQPVGCFDPLFGLGYETGLVFGTPKDRAQDTYRKMLENYDSYSERIYYEDTNFHYTMEGHAHFIYHYSEDLYFTFIGDDDVYLYVNGKRIVDVGGTHPISKVSVNLNDVAEICGLEEGGIYSFDFFYMERHGTAANLSIETNIRVADTSLITEKKAYQDGQEIAYDGVVNYNRPVEYTFSVYNNSEAPLYNLTFSDADIGAILTYKADETFVLPEGVTADKLVLTKYKADGSVYENINGITGLTEDQIRAYLIEGLAIGERLTIGGFTFKILDNKWMEQNGKTYFINHLYTTAVSKPDNVTEKVVSSNDFHRVNKAEYAFESIHLYDWGTLDAKKNDGSFEKTSEGVLIDPDDIIAVMEKVLGEGTLNKEKLSFAVTSPSGNTEGGDVNKYVKAQIDGSFLYQGPKCGMDTFHVTCYEDSKAYPPVRVDVYVYGVDDHIFVLDYNLPVTVNLQEHLLKNDVMGLTTNPHAMSMKLEFLNQVDDLYGEFSFVENTDITYTMKKFMNGVDAFQIKITLCENGKGETPDKWTGVEMYQSVSFVPANVMYYEDDFVGEGAITYVNTGEDTAGNIWAVFESENKGDHQSLDQSLNYGSDPNYAENKTGLTINRLEGLTDEALLAEVNKNIFETMKGSAATGEIPALGGDASNGTIHAMALNRKDAATLMSFTFTGTGFEIVGRTTKHAYALLTIAVRDVDNGGMMAFPVITECVSGDLYQVPFAARKDLPYGTYEVTVIGSNVNEVDRMVYVDGVRVYQPLDPDSSDPSTYYKENESVAEFFEIKELIAGGSMVYGDIGKLEDSEGGALNIMWGFGNTMIENFRPEDGFGDYTLVGCESLEDYMKYGPNNEIYLSNANGATLSYIAFYVVLDEDYEGERSIQVGAHLKTTPDAHRNEYVIVDGTPEISVMTPTPVTQSASLRYGNSAADFLRQDNAVIITSGTEQYYTVDIAWNPVNNNGIEQTLVVIGIDNSETNEILSLTNIKLNGYKVAGNLAAEMSAVQDAYDINACTLMSRVVAIGEALANKE